MFLLFKLCYKDLYKDFYTTELYHRYFETILKTYFKDFSYTKTSKTQIWHGKFY